MRISILRYAYLLIFVLILMSCGEQGHENSDARSKLIDYQEELSKAKYLTEYPPEIDSFLEKDLYSSYTRKIKGIKILAYHNSKLREVKGDYNLKSSTIYIDTTEIYVQVILKLLDSDMKRWVYVFDERGTFIKKVNLSEYFPPS